MYPRHGDFSEVSRSIGAYTGIGEDEGYLVYFVSLFVLATVRRDATQGRRYQRFELEMSLMTLPRIILNFGTELTDFSRDFP